MIKTTMEGPMSTDHTPASETGTPRGRSTEIDAPPARVWNDLQPGRRFSNRIGGHGTQWISGLEFTPSGGTRLSERSEPPAALVAAVRRLTSALPVGRGGGRGSSSSPSASSPSGSLRPIKALNEQS